MKNRIAYLIAAFLVGFAVFAIMRWLFHFRNIEALMFGIIAATAEASAKFVLRFFPRSKKNNA